MPSQKVSRLIEPVRKFGASLFKEHLDPRHAAAAVFLGIFIANVPIYGLQTLAIIGLAALLKLNKPLAIAASFINNPFLQPFLIVGSLEVGHFLLKGKFLRISWTPSVSDLKSQFGAWLIGSIVLGVLLGAVGAAITFLLLRLWSAKARLRQRRARFVNSLFASGSHSARGFVRWKMRLDRVFDILSAILDEEEPGTGPVVDLGCGYGIALGFAAFHHRERRLIGCDLDEGRIAAARNALSGMNAELAVCDVRNFDLPQQASLILIFDVLQYLTGTEQIALLERCRAALAPGGKLIFRIPDCGHRATSRLSIAFDRLIFYVGGNQAGPVVLSAEEYRGALDCAGLQIDQRRFRNRLPIAHLLFVASKPLRVVDQPMPEAVSAK